MMLHRYRYNILVLSFLIVYVCKKNTFTFFVLSQNYFTAYPSGIHNIYTLKELYINRSSLSVTSFLYNPTKKTSKYIEHIFGKKSIHFHHVPYKTTEPSLGHHQLISKYFHLAHEPIKSKMNITTSMLSSICSFEILGYSLLNMDEPFTIKYRDIGPSIGYSSVTIRNNINTKVTCYYRGLYENYRPEYIITPNHYWPTIFFCPIQHKDTCHSINQYVSSSNNNYVNILLQMNLQQTTWSVEFHTKLLQNQKIDSHTDDHIASPLSLSLPSSSSSSNPMPRLAICMVLPYTSLYPSKHSINTAMMYEWIYYYLRLGLRVVAYDRDGNNYHNIFHSEYSQSRNYKGFSIDGKKLLSKDILSHPYLSYYNFTMRGLLDTFTKGIKYDNTEDWSIRDKELRRSSTGNDKTLTLTHCRFELQSLYGIDDVIVADFDEFLYCSQAESSTFLAQSNYIHNTFHYYKTLGYDQLFAYQRYVMNRTLSIIDCLQNRVDRKESIFRCYGQFGTSFGGHSMKSIHIGHTCPLTGFHSSCAWDIMKGLSHDCICRSVNIDRSCQFIHLSTNPTVYECPHCHKRNNMDKKRLQPSELYLMTKDS